MNIKITTATSCMVMWHTHILAQPHITLPAQQGKQQNAKTSSILFTGENMVQRWPATPNVGALQVAGKQLFQQWQRAVFDWLQVWYYQITPYTVMRIIFVDILYKIKEKYTFKLEGVPWKRNMLGHRGGNQSDSIIILTSWCSIIAILIILWYFK